VILVWVGIIAAIALGIRWLIRSERTNRPGGPTGAPPPSAPPRPDDPLEILRARYARGEIDDEEYERRRRILTG
jgi:putative membrane protein